MQWLARREPRRTHPGICWRAPAPRSSSPPPFTTATIRSSRPTRESAAGSRATPGTDYHEVMGEKLKALAERIAELARNGGWRRDRLPAVRRQQAARRTFAGRARRARFYRQEHDADRSGGRIVGLLGVLLTSLELPPDDPLKMAAGRRPTSRGCRVRAVPEMHRSLPDGCARAYSIDPRRCISYLTIERRDRSPAGSRQKHRAGRSVATFARKSAVQRRPLARLLPELAATVGAGPWLTEATLHETPSGKSFLRRWRHTPLARAGLKRLREILNVENPAALFPE